MDGARFANALVALGCTPAEVTWKAGVDALSFGGTKNGLLGVEAVVLFDPARAWEFELRRKRGGHLFSKHRYLSAQMEAYLADGLWLETARARQCPRGAAVGRDRGPAGGAARCIRPRRTRSSRPGRARRIGARGRRGREYYLWLRGRARASTGRRTGLVSARLVCNWSTTEAEVDALSSAVGREEVADRA